MARSVVYFYPTSDVPITVDNVVAAVQSCQGVEGGEERRERFRASAFLSVPYILSILAEDLDGKGMEMLEEMDFVSTGGAPLDTKLGDAMVERGVRLVSRLGSSECGCELFNFTYLKADTSQSSCPHIGITPMKRIGNG
jgi:hypothetical protein